MKLHPRTDCEHHKSLEFPPQDTYWGILPVKNIANDAKKQALSSRAIPWRKREIGFIILEVHTCTKVMFARLIDRVYFLTSAVIARHTLLRITIPSSIWSLKMPQPKLPEPAHAQVDSMLSRKFGKEVANYFSGSLSLPSACNSKNLPA